MLILRTQAQYVPTACAGKYSLTNWQVVEDLEDVRIVPNELVQGLTTHLPKLRLQDLDALHAAALATNVHLPINEDTRVRTEEFDFLGLPTVRFFFKEIDVLEDQSPFKDNRIAAETEFRNNQLMHGQYGGHERSLAVEQLAAAEILWGLDRNLSGKNPNKDDKNETRYSLCVTMAQRQFRRDPDFLRRIERDVVAGRDRYFHGTYPASVHPELRLALQDMEHYHPKLKTDDYWQLARDQFMAENNHWNHWTGKKIVIALDKRRNLMHWFFAEAVQSLCPPGTLERMDNAIKAYAWLNPIQKAGKRFEVNKDFHLRNNPRFDLDRLEALPGIPPMQVHQAVCGAEHIGCHSETVGGKIHRQEMHRKKRYKDTREEEYGWTQFEKLQYGAMGIGTKISRFFLELLDPELHRKYTAHCERIPGDEKVDTVREQTGNGKECFSYRALNFNTHTEDHLDSTDHTRGLAALQISGNFTRGDFILRETNQMFEFPPGSQGFVRGPKQRHCTRGWTGDSRFCQVMTVKIQPWADYPPPGSKEDQALKEKNSKKRKIDSKEEDEGNGGDGNSGGAAGGDAGGAQGRAERPKKKPRTEKQKAVSDGGKKSTAARSAKASKGQPRAKRQAYSPDPMVLD